MRKILKKQRKTQKKHRKLLQFGKNCIIINAQPNIVKRITIELEPDTPSDQSDLFVFNDGQTKEMDSKRVSTKSMADVVKDRKMGPINILDAANYLIQLYYKVTRISNEENIETTNSWDDKDKTKYRCTCTHIEKLLVIANLIAYKNGLTLFEYDMLVNKCGVGIPILRDFLYSTIINGVSDNQIISVDRVNNDAVFPNSYNVKGEICDQAQKILRDVFLRFGAYDARNVGIMFDDFKQRISIPNLKDEGHPLISLELANQYFQSDNIPANVLQNEVFNYIRSYVV